MICNCICFCKLCNYKKHMHPTDCKPSVLVSEYVLVMICKIETITRTRYNTGRAAARTKYNTGRAAAKSVNYALKHQSKRTPSVGRWLLLPRSRPQHMWQKYRTTQKVKRWKCIGFSPRFDHDM